MGHQLSVPLLSGHTEPELECPFDRLSSFSHTDVLKTAYDVESVAAGLPDSWIEEKLRLCKKFLIRAKETEGWGPVSKTSEKYARSGVELMKLLKVTMEEFFELPTQAREDMVEDLAKGLGTLIQDYTSFLASDYTKWHYIPRLPPLTDLMTQCTQESRLERYLNKILYIDGGRIHFHNTYGKITDTATGRKLLYTSRVSQRNYVRINTLYYIIDQLSTLDESLASFSNLTNVKSTTYEHLPNYRGVLAPFSHHFGLALTAVQSAIQQVSGAVAYCLVFMDFHDFDDKAYNRNCPRLSIVKKELSFLMYVLTERAQPFTLKEVMKASYDAFLLDLVGRRDFSRFITLPDHEAIKEELESLKSVFCTSVNGLLAGELVDEEAEVVDGVIELVSKSTKTLIQEFNMRKLGAGLGSNKWDLGVVPMSPIAEKLNPSDPNTILRVLCHRNDDDVVYEFLKIHF